MGVATVAYVILVTLAGTFVAAGVWVPAGIAVLLALGLAVRFEIRWFLDHTRFSKAPEPRPVPQGPVRLRRH